jgi:3-dehydroquinate dehydratase-2
LEQRDAMRILLINGPNLNLLGTRQPEIYGTTTLADIEIAVAERAARVGAEVRCFQSNHEGALIDFLQAEAGEADGVIVNAGAFGHYSLALRDAFVATRLPVVDVHISNVYAREPFRHGSVIADIALGQVSGLGWRGYLAAVEALIEILRERDDRQSL